MSPRMFTPKLSRTTGYTGRPRCNRAGRPGVTKVEDSLAEEPVVRPILNAPSFASGSIVKATTLAEHHAAIDSQVPCRTESAGCPETTRSSKFHEAAVVGSIVFFTSVIFVAGKPHGGYH